MSALTNINESGDDKNSASVASYASGQASIEDDSEEISPSYPCLNAPENEFIRVGIRGQHVCVLLKTKLTGVCLSRTTIMTLNITDGENSLNVTTSAGLKEAVERCKELVLESEEWSEERRWLVHHLVELRLRLKEVEAIELSSEVADGNIISSMKEEHVILGHHLLLQTPSNSTVRCCCCSGIIWSFLNHFYQCRDCAYRCHVKCLNKVKRLCTNVSLSQSPHYISEICPEVGLSAQSFSCFECKAHITFTFPSNVSWYGWPFSSENSLVEPRQCDYDGNYYCPNCHWNNTAIIPARVIHNWDFTERPVCCRCSDYLKIMFSRPIIKMDQQNPQLFGLVEELSNTMVDQFRKKLKEWTSVARFHSFVKFNFDFLENQQRKAINPNMFCIALLLSELKHGHVAGFSLPVFEKIALKFCKIAKCGNIEKNPSYVCNSTLNRYYLENVPLQKIRSELLLMKQYLTNCPEALKKRLVWRLRPHFVDGSPGIFSLEDLLELQRGVLLIVLQQAAFAFTNHIKGTCEVCCGKGYYCQICISPENKKTVPPIFPFDEMVSTCTKCCSVFHRTCWLMKNEECPKCKRIHIRDNLDDPA